MEISVSREVFRLAQVFTISRGSRSEAQVLTVRLHDGEVGGWGECVPYARYGETLESVEAQIKGLPEALDREGLAGLLPAGAARNAVDCALWDLEAKRAGRRVWELAGLPEPRPEITAYTLSLDAPERMREQAALNAHRPVLKIKLGTPDDMPRLEAVREGAPQASIIVDANEGWNAEIYADLAPHLGRLGVALVEQPLPAGADEALRGLERTVPICADESCHDRATLAGLKGKYDVINIKLDKTGGLTEALALAEEARRRGFNLMVGCMVGTSLAMAPGFVVASLCRFRDLDGGSMLAEDRQPALRLEAGWIYPYSTELWG